MLDHLVGLLDRVLNSQVTRGKLLQVHNFKAVTVHEKLRDVQQQEGSEDDPYEPLDAELLAKLYQQKAHADVGHGVGSNEPPALCGC